MRRHEEIRELLALAAAGVLGASEQRGVDEHIAECPDCEAELLEWQAMTGTLARLPAQPPPADLAARTRARVEALHSQSKQHGHSVAVLGLLVMFAWAVTLAQWQAARLSLPAAGIRLSDPVLMLATWMLAGWVTGGVIVVFVLFRPRILGRVS